MTQQKIKTKQELREEIIKRTYINNTTGYWKDNKYISEPTAMIFPQKIGKGKPEIITVKQFNERYAMTLILFGIL